MCKHTFDNLQIIFKVEDETPICLFDVVQDHNYAKPAELFDEGNSQENFPGTV